MHNKCVLFADRECRACRLAISLATTCLALPWNEYDTRWCCSWTSCLKMAFYIHLNHMCYNYLYNRAIQTGQMGIL